MYYQDISNQSTKGDEQAQVEEADEEVSVANAKGFWKNKSIQEDATNELPKLGAQTRLL